MPVNATAGLEARSRLPALDHVLPQLSVTWHLCEVWTGVGISQSCRSPSDIARNRVDQAGQTVNRQPGRYRSSGVAQTAAAARPSSSFWRATGLCHGLAPRPVAGDPGRPSVRDRRLCRCAIPCWRWRPLCALYIAVVAMSLPGATILTVSGGIVVRNPASAARGTCLGATIGATILFLIARTAFGDILARRAGPRLARLAEGFREDAFNYLLFLRLVPIFPFSLVNLAPAMFGVRLADFRGGDLHRHHSGDLHLCLCRRRPRQRDRRAGGGLQCLYGRRARRLPAGFRSQDRADIRIVRRLSRRSALIALVPVAVKRWRARRKESQLIKTR